MSEEYIIFIKNSGGYDFDLRGYLKHISDQEILGNIRSGQIWKEEDIDLHFFEDEAVKKALSEIENLPQRYTFFQAKINDIGKFIENLSLIKDTYPELTYKYYYDETGLSPQNKKDLEMRKRLFETFIPREIITPKNDI
ncbi:MAG: hypothetical protein KAS11_00545 [Candidatus Aenigmarchaeota archaeon]|nr:hypothetical protein [Candidatus Aenigmarchaeota archaeon]